MFLRVPGVEPRGGGGTLGFTLRIPFWEDFSGTLGKIRESPPLNNPYKIRQGVVWT